MNKMKCEEPVIDVVNTRFSFDFPMSIIAANIEEAQELLKSFLIIGFPDSFKRKARNFTKNLSIETGLDSVERTQLYLAVANITHINNPMAEVGVYKGGSARIICEANSDKTLYLFDTFEGLPQLSEFDNPLLYYKGRFDTKIEEVVENLKECKTEIIKGMFPESAKSFSDMKFSFVHLDVDLYQSTKDCLEFFYPKMSTGGIILSHDYQNNKGVNKAINEFFEDKPETILWLLGSQCLIARGKND